MNWAKKVDSIITIVALLLMASGAILYYSLDQLQIPGVIIILVGLVLLILEALGSGKDKEKEQPTNVTPGPTPMNLPPRR